MGTDLDRDFVEAIRPELTINRIGGFCRMVLLNGPPNGVNPFDQAVAQAVLELHHRFPRCGLHDDWIAVWLSLDLDPEPTTTHHGDDQL